MCNENCTYLSPVLISQSLCCFPVNSTNDSLASLFVLATVVHKHEIRS